MKRIGATLGLLVGIVMGHPTRSQAGFLTVDPTSTTLTSGTPTDIGGGVTPLANTPFYTNITNFTGYGYAGGGAASTFAGNTTAMVADDITTAAGSVGGAVNSITFSVANLNSAAVSADVVLSIYNSNGAGGGPGTLLYIVEFTPISFGVGVGLYTYAPGSTLFTVPTSGSFYAGEAFTDGGTTGATTAQLNNMGVGIFNPPTLGSSQDLFFQANSSGSVDTNNPAGALYNFGGAPVANFGFAFSGTPAAVPEPSSLILASLAGVIVAGFARTRRVANRRRLAS
jgi:hypothetical protein